MCGGFGETVGEIQGKKQSQVKKTAEKFGM